MNRQSSSMHFHLPRKRFRRSSGFVGLIVGLAALTASLRGTIVGLNQIVTPDIQPPGVLAVSAQLQHPAIGNSQQFQLELGLTPRFEVAWFQGLKPNEGVFSAEFNVWQKGPHLISAGLINATTRGDSPQPVVEYGFYSEPTHLVVGAIDVHDQAELLLGARRQLTNRWGVAADFQSGPGNSVTIGVTCNLTSSLQVNPALYVVHSHPRRLLGYIVFTWNTALWK